MLESLKDLYISYPFLPVPDAPEFFRHVKDVRLVLVLPAVDLLLGYKNNHNGNYIRIWLTGFTAGTGQAGPKANLKVQCNQLQDDPITASVSMYSWENGVPGNQSYMLCDPELLTTLPEVTATNGYELNPAILILLQEAPKLKHNGTALDNTIVVKSGYNVLPSITNGAISFYGAPMASGRLYPVNQPYALDPDKQAKGALSINGQHGSVALVPTFPVRLSLLNRVLSVTVEELE